MDIRDANGRPRLTVHVDPANPPTIVRADDGTGAPVSLSWDRAMDDAGYLRQCPVCGCVELYRDVKFPRLTLFVLLLAVTAGFLWWQNVYTWPWALLSLVIVSVADVLLAVYNRPRMVCYLCGTVFRRLPVHRKHPRWDADTAERFNPRTDETPAPQGTAR
ncbi:MAG: hypothetical protein AAGE65_08640 [Planctomycetota bacterium]